MPRRPSPQTVRVLAELLAEPDAWRHGYDLARTAELRAGTLYPLLVRLHERGLLDSRWEDPAPRGRPPRHEYRLTPEGHTYAEQAVAAARRPARAPSPRLRGAW